MRLIRTHQIIRLQKWGFKYRPFYLIVMNKKFDTRTHTGAVEKLGWWDPSPAGDGNMHIGMKFDRIKQAIVSGAQYTHGVGLLLARVGLLPPPPNWYRDRVRVPEDDTKWMSRLKKR